MDHDLTIELIDQELQRIGAGPVEFASGSSECDTVLFTEASDTVELPAELVLEVFRLVPDGAGWAFAWEALGTVDREIRQIELTMEPVEPTVVTAPDLRDDIEAAGSDASLACFRLLAPDLPGVGWCLYDETAGRGAVAWNGPAERTTCGRPIEAVERFFTRSVVY